MDIKILEWRSNYRRRHSHSVAQTDTSHLRSSVGRKTLETQKIFNIFGKHIFSLVHDNLRHVAGTDRLIINVGAAELETARVQSQREDAPQCYEQPESR